MKKLIALITGICILATPPSSSFVISEAAMGAVKGLMPILQPIAELAIMDSANHIKGLITGTNCSALCRGSLACRKSKTLSACKEHCQKIEQVGGYELRVRFGISPSGNQWSLAKCVRKAVMKGKQTPEGKGNTKSIAVYSQKDLDDLLSLIALKMAARQIVDTNGLKLTDAQLKTEGKTREAVVKESQALIDRISQAIEKNVQEGIYGNQ